MHLAARLKRHLHHGEYHLAYPLAQELVRLAPTPENYEHLRRCMIWKVQSRPESDEVLQEALKVPGTHEYWEKLALLCAERGNYPQAKAIAERVPGAPAMRLVLAHLADWAMTQHSEAAKSKIPEELHAGLSTIQLTFSQYEKKQDDAARETLNAIGISSPWLEWKLFLRGLMAWSANDNARALENWTRLHASRLPYRFAAPLRLTIDRSFAPTLKPEQSRLIQKQVGLLIPKLDDLYQIREIIGSEEELTPAIQMAQRLLPDLRNASPDLPAKVTNLFYWEIIQGGQPQDMKLLHRYFPLPLEDQQYYRLQALVMENLRDFSEAHLYWNKYQHWIEHSPSVWPLKQAQLARAMVLTRMAEAAAKWLKPPGLEDDFQAFLANKLLNQKVKVKPLSPSAIECYEKAYALAPDNIITAINLLNELTKSDGPRAKVFAREIKPRFPHNLDVLKTLLKFYEQTKNAGEVKEILQQLAAIDPLDRQWQMRLGQTTIDESWQKALQGDEEALATLEQAARRMGGLSLYRIQGLKVAIAFKKKTDAADALLADTSASRLAVLYALIAESIRLKVPKKKWEPIYKQLLEAVSSSNKMEELHPLLELVGYYRNPDTTYRGYASQAKQIAAQVKDRYSANARVSWEAANQMAQVLHRASFAKELKDFANLYLGDYNDPWRLFFLAEAEVMKSKTQKLTRRISYYYWRTHQLINQPSNEMAGPHQYDKLKVLLEERCKKTPEVRQEIELGFE